MLVDVGHTVALVWIWHEDLVEETKHKAGIKNATSEGRQGNASRLG